MLTSIRPEVAQALVAPGTDLHGIVTRNPSPRSATPASASAADTVVPGDTLAEIRHPSERPAADTVYPRAMSRFTLPAWGVALGLACTAAEPAPRDTVVPSPMPRLVSPLSEGLSPVATEVTLVARARPEVSVGDDLALELRVRNASAAAITVVRPVYGSWEHARQPDYRLEWTDERGQTVLDPLGFAPGLDCGVLDPIRDDDRVLVPSGGDELLGAAASARPQHLVLASARPGRYDLRVRYIGQDIPDATPLHLLSAPISITITTGDPAQWLCRARQVVAASDHEYIDVTPARLLPAADGGHWLIFSRYIHTVRAGVDDPRGDIQIRKLGPDLAPTGDATVLHTSPDEVGWLAVTPVPDGALVVFTPGPVGGRSIRTLHVDTTGHTPVAGQPATLQRPPGNPYVVAVARLGDRVGLLHHGGGQTREPLLFTLLDTRGAAISKPTLVADMATQFALHTAGDSFIALSLRRGDFTGGVLNRYDRDGHALGAPVQFPFDPAHSITGVRHHPGGLDLAFSDSGTRGDDPTDRMGLYIRSFDPTGRPLAPAKPLQPESRTDARFGAVTWHGDVAFHASLANHALQLGRGPGDARTLSTTAEERILFEPSGDRLALVWEDTRDDRGPACTKLGDCAPEAYGLLVRADGVTLGPPVRLTHAAAARPLMPSSHDWQRHCE